MDELQMSAFTDKAKQLASKAIDIAEAQEQLDAMHDEFQALLREYSALMPQAVTPPASTVATQESNVPTMKGG